MIWNRRTFLGAMALSSAAPSALPYVLRRESVVFLLGEDVLEDHWKVERLLAKLERSSDPLIVMDKPWEGMGPYIYGSVLKDPTDNLWKCWYTAFNLERYRNRIPFRYRIAYAVSEDGVSWKKPSLGIVDDEGKGDRNNNLIDLGRTYAEAIDVTIAPPDSNAPARYVGLILDGTGVEVHVSDDGLRWRPHTQKTVDPGHSDCHNSLCWDPVRRRWLAHIRPPVYAGTSKRRIAVAESKDLRTWTKPVTVLRPDEADVPEFYSMPVFHHGNLFFGLLQTFNHDTDSLEIELTYSTDGYQWHRLPSKQLYLPVGKPGSFDSGMITTADDIVFDRDEMFLYYGGWNGGHKSNERVASIGRARSPRDRFIGWHATAEDDGFLLTKPCVLQATKFTVNASVRGNLVMALCDEAGEPLPGFSFDDCTPVSGDNLTHAIRWKDDPNTLASRTVRIRIRLRDAEFYALGLS
jgi:hypothetical protein